MTKFKLSKKKFISYFVQGIFGIIFLSLSMTLFLKNSIGKNLSILNLGLIFGGLVIVLNAINLLVCYMIYRGECYYYTKDSIVYEFNFIIKRKVSLPFNKINIVNIKRNFIDILLGGSKLCIGSGSVATNANPEIKLYFDKADAKIKESIYEAVSKKAKSGEEILESDFVLSNEVKEDTTAFCLKKGDILKMTLTKGSIYATFLSLTYLCFTPLAYFILKDIRMKAGESILPFGKAMGICTLMGAILLSVALLFELIYNVIKYYKFKAYREGDLIKISYGLFSIKNYSVPVDKIYGVIVKENIMRRIFRLGTIQLSVVGMGNMENANQNGGKEVSYLFPIASLKRIQEINQALLPEFKVSEKQPQKTNAKSIKHYFIIPNFWCILFSTPALVALTLIFKSWVIPTFFGIGFIIGNIYSFLQYKNARFLVEEKCSQFVSGGFVKKTVLCKTKSIQEVVSIAGFIRRKDKVASQKIIVRGESNILIPILVRNIPEVDTTELS